MTTFIPGNTYRGMTTADREKYMRIKAHDVTIYNKWKPIPYFDNEYTTEPCRLVLELDKKTTKYEHDRMHKMLQDAENIVDAVNDTFVGTEFLFAHVLSRPATFDKKKKVWKYGLHIVFPTCIVSLKTGMCFSKNVAKLFPEEDEGYVDGVYTRTLARLRPAYARKRCKDPDREYPLGSAYYTYYASIGKSGMYTDANIEDSTYKILRDTSLIPLAGAKKTKKRNYTQI